MKFKLIQAFIVVLLICKNEEDPLKIESTIVVTTFLPLYVCWDFPNAQGHLTLPVQSPIWPNFKPIQDSMGFLVVSMNEEDPIKNESARVITTLFIDFSDPQGQLTPKSVMESCQNSNSSKLFCLVLLPARMKKIHPKMKAL